MTMSALPSILGTIIVIFALLIVAHVTGQADPPATTYTMMVPENLVLIPAGTFEIRDVSPETELNRSSNKPAIIQSVHVEAFYMGRYDVTTGEYARFLNTAVMQHQVEVQEGGVYLAGGKDLLCDTYTRCKFSRIEWDGMVFSVRDQKENHPMVCVRWEGAAAYCNWLSVQEGYGTCYNPQTWECDFAGQGFRLPTASEWAYAACGNQNTLFPWGNNPDTEKANGPHSGDPYETGVQPWTTPVGFYDGTLHTKTEFAWPGDQPDYQTGNGATMYGLYDMAGNVWQWCNDPGSTKSDPPCRFWRGGNWYNGEWGTARDTAYVQTAPCPEPPYFNIGFRVVLPLLVHPIPTHTTGK